MNDIQEKPKVDKDKIRQQFADYLKKQKYRNTQERYVVLDGIFSLDKHFNADELYLALRADGAKVSRATVYSTLDLLTKCSILMKHRFQGESAHFELADKLPNHNHLICVECGHIEEFQASEGLAEIEQKICTQFRFKPVDRSLQIFAVCEDPRHCAHNR